MTSFFKKSFLLLGLMLFTVLVYAQTFQAGKNYEEISKTDTMLLKGASSDKVSVVEFFSYGCPWCYRFEPFLEKWVNENQKQVEFSRVPVVFEQGWEVYAKAYYIVKALKLEKLTMPLFEAVQQKQINSEQDLKKFFLKHGVEEKIYNSVSNSPVVDNDVMQAGQTMTDYRISYVPSIVVAGKYKTHIGMVDGDNEKFVALINFLVKKASAEKVQ